MRLTDQIARLTAEQFRRYVRYRLAGMTIEKALGLATSMRRHMSDNTRKAKGKAK